MKSNNKQLSESFSGTTEATMLQSLENLHETSSIDMDNFHLPKPPNAFRGIRRKNSSLRRWLDICSDDLAGWVLKLVESLLQLLLILSFILFEDVFCRSGRYRTSINLLRKFLGDYLIASYLSVVQESGFDDGYVKEIEVQCLFLNLWVWVSLQRLIGFALLKTESGSLKDVGLLLERPSREHE